MAIVLTDNTNYQNIANAIRNKNGSSDTYSPSQMATAINNIPSGGRGLTPAELTLTGYCGYRFYYGNWDWFVTKYGSQITTNNVNDCSHMFFLTQLQSIPFNINFVDTNVSLNSMFSYALLRTLPYLYNPKPSDISDIFYHMDYLQNIPNDYFDTWDFSGSHEIPIIQIFSSCYSLRKIPETFFNKLELQKGYSTSLAKYFGLNRLAEQCYSLDELTNVTFNYLWKGTTTYMGNIVNGCYRLKDFKFKLNQDNTPKIGLFKKQIFDFSNYTGWASSEENILNYNSGITSAKKVTDATSYNLLKDDQDWYTLDVNYSRYNHDSAVNTINTLPDTSATGTNTIKFKGQAGALTDGGAINTLTAGEIAVATVKGWTVTFV